MIKRNPHFENLSDHYLFVEIQKRKNDYLKKNPQAELISLGIGDTTTPFSYSMIQSLMNAALDQGNSKTYQGYGPEQGLLPLREKIAKTLYSSSIDPDEVFISDGAKCDTARLQVLLGPSRQVAIQDPTYPVYLDGSLLHGAQKITSLPCHPENGFFPDLTNLAPQTILYICSPNNPTGTVYNRTQLEKLIEFAHKKQILILFDAAYSAFIQDPNIPKSIYEIEGAKEVAIELNSFSKLAGYTGVRLGWSIVPKALQYNSGESLHTDFKRVVSTTFNGASIISQKGGLALLEPKELKSIKETLNGYLQNASDLKALFESFGFVVYGGVHAPYLWVNICPLHSWEAFDFLLENCHLIVTPGSGFGPSGEGFIRLSAFARRNSLLEALERLKKGLTGLKEKTYSTSSFS